MIRRTMDAHFLNEAANHPEVRPHIGGEGPLDLDEVISNPLNFALVGEHGGFLYAQHEPGRYDVHSLVLPAGRGAWALDAAKAGLRYMFAATDCVEVVTHAPDNNRGAFGLARAVGFDAAFRREAVWPTPEGPCGVAYMVLTLDRWRARDDDALAAGEWFHTALEAAKDAAGSPLPPHEDDEAHNRAAGASVLMARAGNPAKAVWSYNRWARHAGYQTIDLVSVTPPVFDVKDAIVQIHPDALEVLKCR